MFGFSRNTDKFVISTLFVYTNSKYTWSILEFQIKIIIKNTINFNG